MEQTMTMNPPLTADKTAEQKAAVKKDHWLVEVVGGVTLASTIVSAGAMFYLLLVYSILP